MEGPILIVEDDPAIRDMLLDALEQDGYEAVAVSNGIDGITAALLREPSVILLDLNLPLLDGEGVLRELERQGPHAPVVLMTSDPRGDRLSTADGVCGYLPKPFDLDDLITTIELAGTSRGPSFGYAMG